MFMYFWPLLHSNVKLRGTESMFSKRTQTSASTSSFGDPEGAVNGYQLWKEGAIFGGWINLISHDKINVVTLKSVLACTRTVNGPKTECTTLPKHSRLGSGVKITDILLVLFLKKIKFSFTTWTAAAPANWQHHGWSSRSLLLSQRLFNSPQSM